MKFKLIRSATIRLEYAATTLLIDPYFAPKYSMPSYTGRSLNPLVDLPCDPHRIITGLDLIVISHLHSDHFDRAAQNLLPKDLPIVCQPQDEQEIRAKGFRNVRSVQERITWEDIEITRIEGRHGTGNILKEMGAASGFVLKNRREPTLYWAGDTVWCSEVEAALLQMEPSVIITHSCGAVWGDQVLIVMDAEQTMKVCLAAPDSTVIATHMDSLDHATISRECLRKHAATRGIGPGRLLIPLEGEEYQLGNRSK